METNINFRLVLDHFELNLEEMVLPKQLTTPKKKK